MPLKILCVNAIDITREIETRYPPLGLGYLCSSLKKQFGEEAIDFKVVDRDVEAEIANYMPDIVGISAVSQNYSLACRYAATAKRHALPVISGGVHISMLPSSLGKEMDIGVIGEGEKTICDLVEVFIKAGKFPLEHLGQIPGLIYRVADGSLVKTAPRDFIRPIDAIPFPSRNLFRIETNTYIFTSRGCPYRCSFCASSRFWSEVRLFSAEYVANEIETLFRKYNVTHINFYDDLFAVNIPRVRAIVALLKEKGLLGKISYSCAMRANLVTDEAIGLLRELGVKSIGMGLESGSQATLTYLKQDVKVEQNENAVKIIRNHGMTVHGSFIIGSPGETRQDILETFKFIKRTHIEGFSIYLLTPFPGTPVWDYAASRGLVGDTMDWELLGIDFAAHPRGAIILSERLTRKELFALYKLIVRYGRQKEAFALIVYALRHPIRGVRYIARKVGGSMPHGKK